MRRFRSWLLDILAGAALAFDPLPSGPPTFERDDAAAFRKDAEALRKDRDAVAADWARVIPPA